MEDRTEYFREMLSCEDNREFFEKMYNLYIFDESDSFMVNCKPATNYEIMFKRMVEARNIVLENDNVYIVCKNKTNSNDLDSYLNWMDRKKIKEGKDVLLITPKTLTTSDRFFWKNDELKIRL